MYELDPDGGNHSNAFQAYCDMTLHNGGWTMCYTTNENDDLQGLPGFCPHRGLFHDMHQLVLRC